MKPHIHIFTLGVKDLDSMANWYKEKFGWIFIKGNGKIFFRLDKLLLVLVNESELAKQICIWQDGYGFKRVSLTIGFNSEEEVDRIFEELQQKQVMIIKRPGKINEGAYSGYITDPEDNFWELAYHPVIEMDMIKKEFSINEIIYK